MSVYLGKNKISLVGGTTTLNSSGGTDTSDATATTSDLLFGKTAYVKNKKIVGSMNDNGTINLKISSKDDMFNIPTGYHNGYGSVSISDTERSKLIPENIKSGITLLGVTGTASGDGTGGGTDMISQSKVVTPSNIDQTIYPDSGYNCLSHVVVKKIPYVETPNSAGGTTVTIG